MTSHNKSELVQCIAFLYVKSSTLIGASRFPLNNKELFLKKESQ